MNGRWVCWNLLESIYYMIDQACLGLVSIGAESPGSNAKWDKQINKCASYRMSITVHECE
jgi:hypothetical protein